MGGGWGGGGKGGGGHPTIVDLCLRACNLVRVAGAPRMKVPVCCVCVWGGGGGGKILGRLP